MAIFQPESFYETTLTAAVTATQDTIPVTTAPNITAGYMVIEANTSNREIIKYTGVSGTTLTGVVRGLATYGSDSSAGTGKSHPAGVDIANKDVHYYYSQYYDFLMGTSATGANSMRIGDGNTVSAGDWLDTTSGRFWFVNTSSLSAFWGLSSNGQFVCSENGVDSYVVSAGGSGVTGGDGLEITAGVMGIDKLSSGGLRISATKLAVNYDGNTLRGTSAGELYFNTSANFSFSGTNNFSGATSFGAYPTLPDSFATSGSNPVSLGYLSAYCWGTTASNTLQGSADTERSKTNDYNMTKVKEFRALWGGTYRVKFDAKWVNNSDVVVQVYKNGTSTGTAWSITNSYATYSEDLTFSPGDLIQIYYHSGSGASYAVYVKNFRVYYDVGMIALTSANYTLVRLTD